MVTRAEALSLVLLGGLCGLAWAAGLRGFMAQIVTEDSSVSWSGTFGYILFPGLVIGLLLGWAEHLRRTGGRRHWRWLALSPLLFAAVLFSEGPLGVLGIFEDGLGGGAIGVPLYRHGRWVRDLRARVPLGPTHLRPTGPDRRSHLGLDRRVLRRERTWRSPHPVGCGSPSTTTRSSPCSWSLPLSRTGAQSTNSRGRACLAT